MNIYENKTKYNYQTYIILNPCFGRYEMGVVMGIEQQSNDMCSNF